MDLLGHLGLLLHLDTWALLLTHAWSLFLAHAGALFLPHAGAAGGLLLLHAAAAEALLHAALLLLLHHPRLLLVQALLLPAEIIVICMLIGKQKFVCICWWTVEMLTSANPNLHISYFPTEQDWVGPLEIPQKWNQQHYSFSKFHRSYMNIISWTKESSTYQVLLTSASASAAVAAVRRSEPLAAAARTSAARIGSPANKDWWCDARKLWSQW